MMRIFKTGIQLLTIVIFAGSSTSAFALTKCVCKITLDTHRTSNPSGDVPALIVGSIPEAHRTVEFSVRIHGTKSCEKRCWDDFTEPVISKQATQAMRQLMENAEQYGQPFDWCGGWLVTSLSSKDGIKYVRTRSGNLSAGSARPCPLSYEQHGEGKWRETTAMTFMAGSVFATEGDSLWQVEASGKYRRRGVGNWRSASAMTTDGQKLFIVEGSRLYTATKSGSFALFGTGTWRGTKAMAYLDPYLYAVEGDHLWRVHSITRKPEKLGTGNWRGASAMVAHSNGLFITQGGSLWRVELDGSFVRRGRGDWTGTSAMAVMNGRIYAVQANRLWVVDPDSGSFEQSGRGFWAKTHAMASDGRRLYIADNLRLWKVKP